MSDTLILGIFQSMITLAGMIITAMVAIKIQKMGKRIDGRMDELLVGRKAEGKAEGKAEEKSEQIDRDNKL